MNMNMNGSLLSLAAIAVLALSGCNSNSTENPSHDVSNAVIAEQRVALAEDATAKAEAGETVGPQAPRDIDSAFGENTDEPAIFAPSYENMNLCDIHFHKSAEHKGGEFTKYAGNGNGEGYGTGYKYSGTLTPEELKAYTIEDEHNPLHSGDTIEVHYVYTTLAGDRLGNGLGTCLEEGKYPELRVESQVYVLVNDEHADDFTTLNHISTVDGRNQAAGIPNYTGTPVQYHGSTTGPGYNEKISPYQVTWNVRPKVVKVDIATVKEWFHNDGAETFEEHHAHAVRNLVENSNLLSAIE